MGERTHPCGEPTDVIAGVDTSPQEIACMGKT